MLLRAAVLFGVLTLLITEVLSPFGLLCRAPLLFAWGVVALMASVWLYRPPPALPRITMRPVETAMAIVIFCIALPIGVAAWLSAPNSYDALSYHLPRVIYWAQSGSVAFFPTAYFTQISLPPLSEYVMLHSYLISGGDRYVNLISFFAYIGCIVGVSAVASIAGGSPRVQVFAAFFCATLPNAVLQASGAKNESLLAFWLVCVLYFAARRESLFLGLAFGLALATKSTAYMFAPPLIAGMLLTHRLAGRKVSWIPLSACLAAGMLLLNAPQYVRNYQFSGSPLGFDSPYGAGGPFRWANAHLSWKATASNIMRNVSDQLGDRSARWNQAVYDSTIRLHGLLHIDPGDPDSTWPMPRFAPPVNTAHEASANNRWHLTLVVVAFSRRSSFRARSATMAG